MANTAAVRTSRATKKRAVEKEPDREEKQESGDDPNKRHKEDFEQLLDDAVFRVKSKNTRG